MSQIISLSNIFNVVALLLITYNIINNTLYDIISKDNRPVAGWWIALFYCVLWTVKVWGT